MRHFLVLILLIAQVALAGTCLAAPVTVDFNILGPPANDPPLTVDITTAVNPAGLTLKDVTLKYEDFGSGVDFGLADPSGLFGTTGGALIMEFTAPATALAMDFSLMDAYSAAGDGSQLADALVAIFFRNGAFLDVMAVAADFFAYDPVGDPTLGVASGILDYHGSAFDQAVMFFSPDAPIFMASNAAYEPVPEPATFVLLALGLVGIAGIRLFRRNPS